MSDFLRKYKTHLSRSFAASVTFDTNLCLKFVFLRVCCALLALVTICGVSPSDKVSDWALARVKDALLIFIVDRLLHCVLGLIESLRLHPDRVCLAARQAQVHQLSDLILCRSGTLSLLLNAKFSKDMSGYESAGLDRGLLDCLHFVKF